MPGLDRLLAAQSKLTLGQEQSHHLHIRSCTTLNGNAHRRRPLRVSPACRIADATPRLSGSNPGPGALLQGGHVLRNVLVIVYLVVGVVVANSHHYFTHLNSLTSVLSALLAVVLWPLILVGVSLHIK